MFFYFLGKFEYNSYKITKAALLSSICKISSFIELKKGVIGDLM